MSSRCLDMENEGAQSRPRFFGRRSGKPLRKNAQELMDQALPRLAVPMPDDGAVVPPASLFSHPVEQIWLEVGFGGGEHVMAQAQLYPQHGIIGCEPFRNGIASLLGHLSRTPLENVRIYSDDVRHLLPAFPEASLGRVFVLFPDPWPKKRHAERRFIGRPNLDALARVMADGAELRVASDDPVYQEWAAEQLAAHDLFQEIQVTSDRSTLPDDWPVTRYEQKCITGNPPKFFRYQRIPRSASSHHKP